MNLDERIELLEQAQEKINEAVDLITEAVRDTGSEASADAYIIGHLSYWANGNNPYDHDTIPIRMRRSGMYRSLLRGDSNVIYIFDFRGGLWTNV